jgi:pilus assembly protein Flp/PilA
MTLWQWLLTRYRSRAVERGQGLVEYALILIFVAVVVIAILTILSPGLVDIYQNVIDHL